MEIVKCGVLFLVFFINSGKCSVLELIGSSTHAVLNMSFTFTCVVHQAGGLTDFIKFNKMLPGTNTIIDMALLVQNDTVSTCSIITNVPNRTRYIVACGEGTRMSQSRIKQYIFVIKQVQTHDTTKWWCSLLNSEVRSNTFNLRLGAEGQWSTWQKDIGICRINCMRIVFLSRKCNHPHPPENQIVVCSGLKSDTFLEECRGDSCIIGRTTDSSKIDIILKVAIGILSFIVLIGCIVIIRMKTKIPDKPPPINAAFYESPMQRVMARRPSLFARIAFSLEKYSRRSDSVATDGLGNRPETSFGSRLSVPSRRNSIFNRKNLIFRRFSLTHKSSSTSDRVAMDQSLSDVSAPANLLGIQSIGIPLHTIADESEKQPLQTESLRVKCNYPTIIVTSEDCTSDKSVVLQPQLSEEDLVSLPDNIPSVSSVNVRQTPASSKAASSSTNTT